jgi:hypothetical protein
MAFADPQSVTYNTKAVSMPRVSSSVNAGRFEGQNTVDLPGYDFSFEISNQYGSRTRRLARLNISQLAPNPFLTGSSVMQSSSVYVVVDTPADLGIVDPVVAVLGLNSLSAWLTASSNANALKLVQGQN